MLDQAILDQLRPLFAELVGTYAFVLRPSRHEQQAELEALALALATTSTKLSVRTEGEPTATVELALHKDGSPTGVVFRGVPGGHEFTSLVLAILNADGKGKLPDPGFLARIRALRAGAVRTFVSLTCTNCPDVVQALNLVALDNPDVSHEMIDGGLAEDEVQRLGIQGVPAVFIGDKLVHVGKSSLAELVEVLERELGRNESVAAPSGAPKPYDVVVIGGGPAGSAAAIYSARKGLRTAIVAQRIGGQMRETLGIENFIGMVYTEGVRLSSDIEAHLRKYDIDVLEHRRVERIEGGADKVVHLQGGERLAAPALIIASGAKWRELGVPGEKEHIGRGVAFCPHCDGPFYKGKAVAVVGGGNSGVEAAIDLAGICSKVTLLEFAETLKADAVLVDKLRSLANVTVVTSARTTEVVGHGGKVVALRYEERQGGEQREIGLDGVFVQIGLVPNSGFVKDLVATNGFGEIVVDERGRTSVPGIYAAGDVTTVPFKQIVIAMGEGAKVALAAFEDTMRKVA